MENNDKFQRRRRIRRLDNTSDSDGGGGIGGGEDILKLTGCLMAVDIVFDFMGSCCWIV